MNTYSEHKNTTISLTKYIVSKGLASKKFTSDKTGYPAKHSETPFISIAKANTIQIKCLTALTSVFSGLKSNECLGYGIAKEGLVNQIYSKFELNNNPKYQGITRSRDNFKYPNKALAYIDCDGDNLDFYSKKLGFDITPDRAVDIIQKLNPAFKDVQFLARHSASSCFKSKETKEWLIPPKSFHLYFVVNDGDNIPQLKQILSTLMWVNGYGHIQLSKPNARTGVCSRLARGLFDPAIYEPERVDFCSGAQYSESEPFYQDLPKPVLLGGTGALTVANIKLTKEDIKSAKDLIAREKENLTPTVLNFTVKHIRKHNPSLSKKEAETRAKKAIKAHDLGFVSGDTPITFQSGESFTFNQLIAMDLIEGKHPYDGRECKDIYEPDYNGGGVCAYFNFDYENPLKSNVFSFAHGGRKYSILCKNIRKNDLAIARYFKHKLLKNSKFPFDDDTIQEIIDLQAHTIAIKAIHGSGKTIRLVKSIANKYSESGMNVLIITHRIRLSIDTANKIIAIDYLNKEGLANNEKMRKVIESRIFKLQTDIEKNLPAFKVQNKFSMVVNSVVNPEYSFTNNVDLLIIDEADQVIEQVVQNNGTVAQDKQPAILLKLKEIAQRAKKVLLLSADLEYGFLSRVELLTTHKPVVYLGQYQSGDKQRYIFTDKQTVINSTIDALRKGETVFLPIDMSIDNQLKLVEKIRNIEGLQDKKILLFNSENKLNFEQHKTFDNYLCAEKPDLLIASPSLGSGVSIEKYRFNRVFGLCVGTVSISNFLQQIRRLRYIEDYEIYLYMADRVNTDNNFKIPSKINGKDFKDVSTHEKIEYFAKQRVNDVNALYQKSETHFVEKDGLIFATFYDASKLDLHVNLKSYYEAKHFVENLNYKENFKELLRYDGVTESNIVDNSNVDYTAATKEDKAIAKQEKNDWVHSIEKSHDIDVSLNERRAAQEGYLALSDKKLSDIDVQIAVKQAMTKRNIAIATDKKSSDLDTVLISRFHRNRNFSGLRLRELLSYTPRQLQAMDVLERESGKLSKSSLSYHKTTVDLLTGFLKMFNIEIQYDSVNDVNYLNTDNAYAWGKITGKFNKSVIDYCLKNQFEWNKLIRVNINKDCHKNPVKFINAVFKKLNIDFYSSGRNAIPQSNFCLRFNLSYDISKPAKSGEKIRIYRISHNQKVTLNAICFRHDSRLQKTLDLIQSELNYFSFFNDFDLKNDRIDALTDFQKRQFFNNLASNLIANRHDIERRAKWLCIARLLMTDRQYCKLIQSIANKIESPEKLGDLILENVEKGLIPPSFSIESVSNILKINYLQLIKDAIQTLVDSDLAYWGGAGVTLRNF